MRPSARTERKVTDHQARDQANNIAAIAVRCRLHRLQLAEQRRNELGDGGMDVNRSLSPERYTALGHTSRSSMQWIASSPPVPSIVARSGYARCSCRR